MPSWTFVTISQPRFDEMTRGGTMVAAGAWLAGEQRSSGVHFVGIQGEHRKESKGRQARSLVLTQCGRYQFTDSVLRSATLFLSPPFIETVSRQRGGGSPRASGAD